MITTIVNNHSIAPFLFTALRCASAVSNASSTQCSEVDFGVALFLHRDHEPEIRCEVPRRCCHIHIETRPRHMCLIGARSFRVTRLASVHISASRQHLLNCNYYSGPSPPAHDHVSVEVGRFFIIIVCSNAVMVIKRCIKAASQQKHTTTSSNRQKAS